jgi:hypothetical protein
MEAKYEWHHCFGNLRTSKNFEPLGQESLDVLVDVAAYIRKSLADKEGRRCVSASRSSHLYSRDSRCIGVRGNLKVL